MTTTFSWWLLMAGAAAVPALCCLWFYRGSVHCCGLLSDSRFFELPADSVAPMLLCLLVGVAVLAAL